MTRHLVCLALVLGVLSPAAHGGDWPMDRGDAARSGYTAENLPASLSLRWTAREAHAPVPAWPNVERLTFDRAYRVVAVGGRCYYGTSSDNKVVARDSATGKVVWTFWADAPVRFAPVVWRDRVLAACDDGFLYALSAADGHVVWKLRGGPRDDMVLGNDRMVSRWPARGGPVVVGDTVYFAAGIWPSEGFYLRAVDAATGRVLWCNDTSGSLVMKQPHPGAQAASGVAAQGALAVSGDALLAPTGRAVPAVFNRADGRLRYFHLSDNIQSGGSEIVAFDDFFINGGTLFSTADGAMRQAIGPRAARPSPAVTHSRMAPLVSALHPKWLLLGGGKTITARERAHVLAPPGKAGKVRQTLNKPAWTAALPGPVASLIVASDWAIAGGDGQIVALDVHTGAARWRGSCTGTALSLAVADGRLLASTDRGTIHAYGPGDAPAVELPPPAQAVEPSSPAIVAAAEQILKRSGVTQGYCLDFGCGDGSLSLELARRSSLRIYAVAADAAQVAAARRKIVAAGLFGTRVTVHQAEPFSLPYPNCFADLVVSQDSVTQRDSALVRANRERLRFPFERLLRPFGGTACFGPAEAMRISVRGPLAGAGQWTHLYADSGNTVCSEDQRLAGPLKALWFRDTDQLMPTRHGRAPSPLVAEGRMFVEGLDELRAVNLYNGDVLWRAPLAGLLAPYHQDHLTGVAATGSNMCLGGERLYLHNGASCLSFDVKTGRRLAVWNAPAGPGGKPGRWGYLAYNDGLVVGSLADPGHVVKESWDSFRGKLDMSQLLSESKTLFALDAKTGTERWRFTAEHSIRHNTIAMAGERVFLIDRPKAPGDTAGKPTALKPDGAKPIHEPGRLVCLDMHSGRVRWENRQDIFGTLLAASGKHGVLLMSYQPTSFQLDSEIGGRMAAFRVDDGHRLWDHAAKYRSRPVVNDRAIYAEPGKWDLLTGRPLPFQFSRSYGCGVLAGSQRLLVFRSATLGYYDLEGNRKTENFGGIRPGCWINAIPAGGVVVMADAASWCTCSYLNQATLALEPASDGQTK